MTTNKQNIQQKGNSKVKKKYIYIYHNHLDS